MANGSCCGRPGLVSGTSTHRVADGSGSVERVTDSSGHQGHGSWSPDGQCSSSMKYWRSRAVRRVFSARSRIPQSDRSPFDADVIFEQSPRPLTGWTVVGPMSPPNPSRPGEVFVQPFPGARCEWPISTDGGTTPVWSRLRSRAVLSEWRQDDGCGGSNRGRRSLRSHPQLLFEGHYQRRARGQILMSRLTAGSS